MAIQLKKVIINEHTNFYIYYNNN